MMEIQKREGREKEEASIFEEITAKIFSNLTKESDIQFWDNMNPKMPAPRHILIKMSDLKDEGTMLKAAKRK